MGGLTSTIIQTSDFYFLSLVSSDSRTTRCSQNLQTNRSIQDPLHCTLQSKNNSYNERFVYSISNIYKTCFFYEDGLTICRANFSFDLLYHVYQCRAERKTKFRKQRDKQSFNARLKIRSKKVEDTGRTTDSTHPKAVLPRLASFLNSCKKNVKATDVRL